MGDSFNDKLEGGNFALMSNTDIYISSSETEIYIFVSLRAEKRIGKIHLQIISFKFSNNSRTKQVINRQIKFISIEKGLILISYKV